jgi:hypothetical protein
MPVFGCLGNTLQKKEVFFSSDGEPIANILVKITFLTGKPALGDENTNKEYFITDDKGRISIAFKGYNISLYVFHDLKIYKFSAKKSSKLKKKYTVNDRNFERPIHLVDTQQMPGFAKKWINNVFSNAEEFVLTVEKPDRNLGKWLAYEIISETQNRVFLKYATDFTGAVVAYFPKNERFTLYIYPEKTHWPGQPALTKSQSFRKFTLRKFFPKDFNGRKIQLKQNKH